MQVTGIQVTAPTGISGARDAMLKLYTCIFLYLYICIKWFYSVFNV